MTKSKKRSIKIERLLTLYQIQVDAIGKVPELMSLSKIDDTLSFLTDTLSLLTEELRDDE